jgi:hypothetical protein
MSPIERYKTCVITGQTKGRKPKIDPKTEKVISYLNLFDTIRYRNDKTETGCSHVSPRFRKSASTSNGKRDRERERNSIVFVETAEVLCSILRAMLYTWKYSDHSVGPLKHNLSWEEKQRRGGAKRRWIWITRDVRCPDNLSKLSVRSVIINVSLLPRTKAWVRKICLCYQNYSAFYAL